MKHYQPSKSNRIRWLRSLLPPAVISGVLLLIFALFSLPPFGQNIFAWGDMTQQSIPLLLDFKEILSGEFDLFLNTANSGGMSFWGVLLFFLASPFSFLVAFVNSSEIYMFAGILVWIKLSVAGWTANLFFQKLFPNLTWIQQTALSVLYGLCGFGLFYYQNLVWLDMLYLFPLLLIGYHRLLKEQKIGCFIAFLTLTVAVNYYLSYMVILFLVLSMGVYLLVAAPKEKRKRIAIRFCIASLLSALLSAVVWLPSFFQYLHSARTSNVFTSLQNSSILTNIPTVLPVILCTSVIISVIPIYFIQRLYQNRKAKALFYVYLLLLVPVVLEPINKMWHTGSYQAFPVRYGYITILLGLILTAMSISHSNEQIRLSKMPIRTRKIMLVIILFFVASLCSVGILLLVKKFDIISRYVGRLWSDGESFFYFFLFAGLAMLIYFVCLLLYQNRMVGRAVFSILFCCLVLCEGIFYSSIYIGSASRNTWTYDCILALDHKVENQGLFRTKLNNKYFDVNMVGALGYNTTSHYTSLTDEDYLFVMKRLGYSGYWMELGSNGGTLLTDMLLANKYVIYKNSEVISDQMMQVCDTWAYQIAENTSVTSFGIPFTTDDITSLETLPDTGRMELQQWLSNSIYNCGTVVQRYEPTKLDQVEITEADGKTVLEKTEDSDECYLYYKIDVSGKQSLYFDCFDQASTALKEAVNDSFTVMVNGIYKESDYPSQKNNGLLYLGTFDNETVEITLQLQKDVEAKSFGVYGMDEEALAKAQSQKAVTTLERTGNTISGTVTSESDDQYLLLPLSWNSGYTATVNGENVEIYRIFDTFMAVKLSSEENEISLTYMPTGFLPGVALSIGGVVLTVVWLWIEKRKGSLQIRWLESAALVAFFVLFVVVLLVIYGMPLLFCGIPS